MSSSVCLFYRSDTVEQINFPKSNEQLLLFLLLNIFKHGYILLMSYFYLYFQYVKQKVLINVTQTNYICTV